ncbi:hypothetical protein OGAPHI_002795 [Ogataea philodendri]|uniref:Uncharacterized protein n=1 Tax=Ogataea philodendri TaxID=1378263 RepID=A0A9P8T6Q2_9ASCO|nr:uncharacterized protein OGAPHI_002795 [Ogataea philodendri]KAH3667146.1 hypothetical protein OGAPHI_002795 [Ogataea philodendri]
MVSLAFLTASSSVWNLETATTGPKISSLTIFISWLQSANTVGWMKYPAFWTTGSSPRTTLAPSFLPDSMYPLILSNWPLEMTGPMTLSWTRILELAVQFWPELYITPKEAHLAAFSKSASSKTTNGDLPPHSNETFFKLAEALCMIFAPVAVDPVNATLSRSG